MKTKSRSTEFDAAVAPEREVQREVEIVLHSFSEALNFAAHRKDQPRPNADGLLTTP